MHPIRNKDKLTFFRFQLRQSPLRTLKSLSSLPFSRNWPAWYRNTPVYLRKKTTDILVYKKIFIDREYDFPLTGPVQYIIDAGANVGLAAVFFSVKYPQARIIAIEPEESNFEVLCRNVASYPNIIPVRGALGASAGFFRIRNKEGDKWNFTMEPATGPDADGRFWTIENLCREHAFPRIDFLKIDIEGGEESLFAADTQWIRQVRYLSIELHDFILPGSSNPFFRTLADYAPFSFLTIGENHLIHFTSHDVTI